MIVPVAIEHMTDPTPTARDMTVGIITAINNERENLPNLLTSVVGQTCTPAIWVIIDDGSTDGSSRLIREAANKHSWIHVISLETSNKYDIRKHYTELLQRGYEYIHDCYGGSIDYYMILDGDMCITEGYIKAISTYMNEQGNIAMVSGGIYVERATELVLEPRIDIHPAGGATLLDGELLRDIGGIPVVSSFCDSVILAKARVRGYETRHLVDIEEKAIQKRPTGNKGNMFKNAMMRGANIYELGYHPFMLLHKFVWASKEPPYSTGFGLVAGYLLEWVKRTPRSTDDEVVQYYRRQRPCELLRMIKRKILASVRRK